VTGLSWQSIHLAAYREATRLHHELGIDVARVVDPFAALAALGVVVMRQPLEAAAGMYLPPNLAAGSPPGVLINARHPLTKQRFTAAHELGHHRRDAAAVFDSDTELLPRRDDRHAEIENLAETFAAWFLMPKPLVDATLAGLATTPGLLTPGLAYRFALAVRVSYRAAVHHLGDLGLISGNHRRALLQITPRSVKEQLGARSFLETLRPDVWQVDIDRDRGLLAPMAGDVLAIEVAEAPSTGYLWSIKAPPGVSQLGDEWQGDTDGFGGEGLHRFWLRIDQAGLGIVELEERRPWEAEVTARRQLALAAEARPEPGISDPGLLLEPIG
jgi:Zn-dependent peptidase ImmA (M78 family)/predicted secreted protein